MNKKYLTDKALASTFYRKAKARAEEYLHSPEKLEKLLKEAKEKAKSRQGPLGEIWNNLTACIRLLKAYMKGEYHTVPWKSLVLIVGSIIYFVMPLDAMPDFILGLGFLDDAGLIAWTVQAIASDIDAFTQWEESLGAEHAEDDSSNA